MPPVRLIGIKFAIPGGAAERRPPATELIGSMRIPPIVAEPAMRRLSLPCAILSAWAVAGLAAAPALADGALDRIRSEGTIRIGHRVDAAPYSYRDADGNPAGYTVDLCRAVTAAIAQDLGIPSLAAEFVATTTESRFDALTDGRIDLLCGATTATLTRRAQIDFSIPTFIDGASTLFRADGPDGFDGLAGQRIGVRTGTTTEDGLRATLERLGIEAEIVAVESHDAGLAMLEAGDVEAYFADRGILAHLLAGAADPGKLRLSERFFSREPFAIGLPRGDDDLRLAVDRALSRLYQSPRIGEIYRATFGELKPTPLLQALFVVSALPE